METINNPQPAPRNAKDAIRNILLDVLPPDAAATPYFSRVLRARFTAQDKITGEVEMADGWTAEIEAWKWMECGWAFRWVRFDGGSLSWEDGRWWRIGDLGQRIGALPVVTNRGVTI